MSEGVIALHTCLILARNLRALGAEVLLTRTRLAAVSDLDIETFDTTPYIAAEFRASSDLALFDQLLNQMPFRPEAFTDRFNSLKSDAKRDFFFINRADLIARADKINAFKPHLTIVVHFDADDSDRTQDKVNEVRGYVEGNVFADEMATREQRASIVRHLVDGHRWIESSVFTSTLVHELAAATKIKVMTDAEDVGAIKVSDGVYARNLALSRLLRTGATAYLECLYYSYTAEFRRLAVADRQTEVDGLKFEYSSRLDDLVAGLEKGILEYVGVAKRPLAQLQ